MRAAFKWYRWRAASVRYARGLLALEADGLALPAPVGVEVVDDGLTPQAASNAVMAANTPPPSQWRLGWGAEGGVRGSVMPPSLARFAQRFWSMARLVDTPVVQRKQTKDGAVNDWEQLRAAVAHAPVCLVEVRQVQGSAPRGRGAWMAVHADGCIGSVGGGHLEWQAQQLARTWLQQGMLEQVLHQRMALGPALGQCCGGAVELVMQALDAAQLESTMARLQAVRVPVALFGAGHVGHALVRALHPLPFAVHWIDSREDMLPTAPAPHVYCEHSEPVQGAVATLPAQSLVLVMSFSHAEDLDIVCACLRRQRAQRDLPFIGLIGSATKWAVFQKRLAERGFSEAEIAHITCPIGIAGVPGKEPEVIAVAVAAQLLQLRAQQLAGN